jgi:hypothetical protein
MMIPRLRTVVLALLAAILPLGFALAQGGPSNEPAAAPPPPITGQSSPLSPAAAQESAGQAPGSTVGLSRTAPDGSTKIVPARPCSAAARETDGTTTCVGIPR